MRQRTAAPLTSTSVTFAAELRRRRPPDSVTKRTNLAFHSLVRRYMINLPARRRGQWFYPEPLLC